jgi:CRISPR-associated exonuclease Cas4
MNREELWSVSDVLNHLYCPWITFNWYVLKIPQGKTVKTEEGIRRQNDYLSKAKKHPERGIAGIRSAKYIVSKQLRSYDLMLAGVCDIVIYPGELPAPLDIKNAAMPKRGIRANHRLQLACYALMLESEINDKINTGYIYYIKDRLTQKIILTDEDKEVIKNAISEMNLILEKEIGFGKPMSWKCCRDCFYRKVCVKCCGL